jgi:phosphoglycolate phosphatase
VTASPAVLFDFDGTLADTAADLCAALNDLRKENHLTALQVDAVRPYASMGARGMLRIGFGLKPGDARYEDLRTAFLDRYERRMCEQTRVFPGIPPLLDFFATKRIRWGIVTNKAMRFTEQLVRTLRLSPNCVVGGDSTPHLKPHPASLLLAAEKLNLPPAWCYYLGDDLRDIQAARAAGMRAVAVEWGYVSPDNGAPSAWNPDVLIREPLDLVAHL